VAEQVQQGSQVRAGLVGERRGAVADVVRPDRRHIGGLDGFGERCVT
jgi:hypothetical protein